MKTCSKYVCEVSAYKPLIIKTRYKVEGMNENEC